MANTYLYISNVLKFINDVKINSSVLFNELNFTKNILFNSFFSLQNAASNFNARFLLKFAWNI